MQLFALACREFAFMLWFRMLLQKYFALAATDIVIHGFVEDLNPCWMKMRVSVAPLRLWGWHQARWHCNG